MQVLVNTKEISAEFKRCCSEYSTLDFAVAWIGNPEYGVPFDGLGKLQTINATAGIAFNQTHPDGLKELLDLKATVKVMGNNPNSTFHPKVFLFRKGHKACLIIGSSNLTHSGFTRNTEACVSCETHNIDQDVQFQKILKQLEEWHNDRNAFYPDFDWLEQYRKSYLETLSKQRQTGLQSPQYKDNPEGVSEWLSDASWSEYYQRIATILAECPDLDEGYRHVLDSAKHSLSLPWIKNYLDEVETRKLIGGRKPFAHLGNTTASGNFAGLLKSGTETQHDIILTAVNNCALLRMNSDADWVTLRNELSSLFDLGFKMSCWGRLLCISRPDLYSTMSSKALKRNLSKAVGQPMNKFDEVDGYINFLKFIYSSNWYNSKEPVDKQEKYIWDNRVALLDVIFH
ncbi:phospholipase D-like domain-containing protein [Photobacterium lutimaris]|uniref:Phospholipase D-like domain-containing protein n=1 Tax=Photobacterium lutimaris TaxID=388278 RepID=A0A2T3IVW6_9GAMM|nr:phospholipase D family protein [Photobacterium lutimaris]PSU32550.1 hypothetical protein C9I99_18315 [Photobacterium lutimaris]TDR77760.1 phospholipase D-like protein [Photobacterium lutimaris]